MSNCWQEVRTNECLEEKDYGYSQCTTKRDNGYKKCCTWWPCSWLCKAWVWISNIVCVAWEWIKHIVCIAWKYIKKFICVIVDIISSVINAFASLVWAVIALVGTILQAILDIIVAIPLIGRFIGWVVNLITEAANILASLPDAVLTLAGIMPEKKLRLLVIIQRDEQNQPIVKDSTVVKRAIQYVINTFQEEVNVKVIPVEIGDFTTAFSKKESARDAYIKVSSKPSDVFILDVCCETCAVLEDLTSKGSLFELKMLQEAVWGNGRRFLGYGAPIVAFAVRNYTDSKAGCSLGPLVDYVTVKFNPEDNGKEFLGKDSEGQDMYRLLPLNDLVPNRSLDAITSLAHEVGHACNLLHKEDPNNLMNGIPARKGHLTVWQKALVRSSRHVTYI